MKLITKLASVAAVAVLLSTVFFFSAGSQADNHAADAKNKTANATDQAGIDRIRQELSKMIPQANEAEIIATGAQGVFRMELEGNFAYAYTNGDFILLGDLYNTKEKVNVGDVAKSAQMATLISEVPLSKMIVFGPKDAKRHITVFTDIDCGYCRKLHNEVPQLTAAGVQVRYLAFPRAL